MLLTCNLITSLIMGFVRTSGALHSSPKYPLWAEVYARWGLSLNDAINTFLVKSIEVGELPFGLRPEAPSYEAIAAVACKPELNAEGVAVLPAEWDDGGE